MSLDNRLRFQFLYRLETSDQKIASKSSQEKKGDGSKEKRKQPPHTPPSYHHF